MRCTPLRGAILAGFAALALSGCENSGEITEPLAEWQVQSASLDQVTPQDLVPYHSVARAVAMALDDDVVRGELLRSMRMSQYNENKLVLQDFLERAESLPIRNKVGTDGLLKRLAAALPIDVDFYAPSREQRRSWTGSDDYLVAAIGDPDADRALALSPDGSSQIITSPDAGVDIVFVIHPAEHKTEYPNRSPLEGDRIEDPPGPTPLFQQCQEEWCSGGGGGGEPPPLPPGTYMDKIMVYFGDGIFAGDPEIRFETWKDGDTHVTDSDTLSVEKNAWVYHRMKIYNQSASSNVDLTADLWEVDDWLTGADDYEGESIPSITAGVIYNSWDALTQSNMAKYEISIGS